MYDPLFIPMLQYFQTYLSRPETEPFGGEYVAVLDVRGQHITRIRRGWEKRDVPIFTCWHSQGYGEITTALSIKVRGLNWAPLRHLGRSCIFSKGRHWGGIIFIGRLVPQILPPPTLICHRPKSHGHWRQYQDNFNSNPAIPLKRHRLRHG